MAMKLHQLRAFVAIAEHGSVHAAARALFLTQPAITKAIRELETDVGVALLMRNTQGVVVTERGMMLLERARLIVNELERAEAQMALARDGYHGKLNIGVTPMAGLTVLPAAFDAFRKRLPDTAVTFLEYPVAQVAENLRNGKLDFALAALADPPEPSSIRSVELLSFPSTFAVRRNSPLARATSLADLASVEWLHTDVTLKHEALVKAIFEIEGLPPPRQITLCTSQALFYSMAVGIDAVVSWSMLSLGSPALGQQFVELDFVPGARSLHMYLMQREGSIMTRPAETFMQCILEEADAVRNGLTLAPAA